MRKSGNGTTTRRKESSRAKETTATTARAKRAAGGTDWARVAAKTDADIARDVANDPDAILFTDEMLEAADVVEPERRTPVTIRVEPDVLAFFKRGGRGYQTRMHAVLRAYMDQSRHRRK